METTEERKARLKALRDAKLNKTKSDEPTEGADDGPASDDQERAEEGEEAQRTLKFRNYKPKDKTLRVSEIEAAPPPSEVIETAILEEQRAQVESDDENRPVNIVSKKANWDLKRDVEKRLQRLEKRTQRAIVELLRERLDKEAEEETDSGSESEADSDASDGGSSSD